MENAWVVRIVLFVAMLGTGVLLIWMARAAASGRLKRNDLAGIRIPSTMASDEAWLAAHARAERPTIYAGMVSAASGIFALLPLPLAAVAIGVLVSASIMLALVLYGARTGGKAATAVTNDDHR